MKVALVIEWLDAWRGGAETSTLQFIHHLMTRDIDLHVFTRSRPSPTPGMSVHTIGGASMSRTRRSMTFSSRVERLVRADFFDIVHAISACRGADIYQPRGGSVAESIDRNLALHARPAVRSIRRCANRMNLKQRYMLRMERAIMRDPEGPVIVAISDYVVRQLKRHYDLPDRRIRKVFNGVTLAATDPSERARLRDAIRRDFRISPTDFVVLLVAHNFRLKGVARWMEAMSLLRKRGATNVRSLVIGKGESDRWHRLAARLGIADSLTFTGPSDRVRAFLHGADVLVHPTYYDPCSRVVLEAMAEGLPCVTTRWDGAAEMIEDGKNGFVLVDPADVTGLADCVERLASESFRAAMGRAAYAVADQLSMARHASRIVALYDELAVDRAVRS